CGGAGRARCAKRRREGIPGRTSAERRGTPFPASSVEQPLEDDAGSGEDLTLLTLQPGGRLREPGALEVLGAGAHRGAFVREGDVHLPPIARVRLALDETALFQGGEG